MATIYDYLKHVGQKSIHSLKDTPVFFTSLLVFATVPLSHTFNNIALILFGLSALYKCQRSNWSWSRPVQLLVVLYGLMLLSLAWTISLPLTLKALPKEIALLLIPLFFYFAKPFTWAQLQKWITYSSLIMLVYALFYLLRACVRFALTGNEQVFFYHELVTEKVNAIHVSVFMLVAFFGLLQLKTRRLMLTYSAAAVVGLFIFLLSSKSAVVVFLTLLLCYIATQIPRKQRIKAIIAVVLFAGVGGYFALDKVVHRYRTEWISNSEQAQIISVDGQPETVRNVSAKSAWSDHQFSPNDYFAGTAFRVYQIRIFNEIMHENAAWLTGLGLNASYVKIQEKSEEYNLFQGNETAKGYGTKNFHNQYLQVWAELGILGLLLLVSLLIWNLKNAYRSKDFVQFAFGIGMIIIFLTESFLWRQRGITYFVLLFCILNMQAFPLSTRSTTIK